ncbi:unnamed protein product, partial [Ectocarpus sp. 12 AP-2014]
MPQVPSTAQSPEARSVGIEIATRGRGRTVTSGGGSCRGEGSEGRGGGRSRTCSSGVGEMEGRRGSQVRQAPTEKGQSSRAEVGGEGGDQATRAEPRTSRLLELEDKLRKALSEVVARERQLKAREESWKTDHAQKLSELQLLQRRLRQETEHQVDLERMKVTALVIQVASHAKSLEDARARVAATDEDLERFRQQQRRTPEGGLRQEVYRLGAAKAKAEAQIERERSLKNKALLEKEEYRANIHKLARALRRHQ